MTDSNRGEHEPDPRMTLANERTLLAWFRTALAFVVTGIAAAALGELVEPHWLLVLVTCIACVIGAVTAVLAYVRWQAVQQALREQRPVPEPRAALLLVLAVVGLAVVGVALLVMNR